uniref:Uncharacterized protein n=1 Tax=Denticeps clupeoides TaxID=299321 RepID=A0AAY4BEE0_9TELE
MSLRIKQTNASAFLFSQFLFHYSKAQNSMGSVQRESHSVHPLMRLSPSLSQRRKKQLLLTVRSLCFISSPLINNELRHD